MNTASIVGRLTVEPDLRYTPEGTAVADVRVAVDGINDRTQYIPVTVWGKQAEALADYNEKGDRIGIEGRIESEEWTQDDQNRSRVKLVARNVQFLEPADNNGQKKSA